jgi:hypothetical protein
MMRVLWLLALLCVSCGGRSLPGEVELFSGYLVSGCWEQTQGLPPWSPDVPCAAADDGRCRLDLLALESEPLADACQAEDASRTSSDLFPAAAAPPRAARICQVTGKCTESDPDCVACGEGLVLVPVPQ